jgi:hypothetical protein
MMAINFIVTCHDKEQYLPHLIGILRGYKNIWADICLCYNGSIADFACTIRRPNMGHQHGDHDLTMSGYNHFKTLNDGFRFVKLGIDTFLLDEQIIAHIFETMERDQCCYAGNRWHGEGTESLATDIMFLDTRFGNPLNPPHGMEKDGPDFERWMWLSIRNRGLKWLEIQQRRPVHPGNRMECEQLKWTMHHQLENNLANISKWGF